MKTTTADPKTSLSGLYEKDETAWLEVTVELIRRKDYRELDYENLEEFLDSMAKSQRREVRSRLKSLMMHLLKWQYQSAQRTDSWRLSILHQRHELEDMFQATTLRNHGQNVLSEAYRQAVRLASAETGLAEKTFPVDCPYTFDFLVSDDLPKAVTGE